MMSIIRDFKVEDTMDGTVLTIYIKPYFVEFADEDGNITKNTSLRKEIYKLLSGKLNNSKVAMCKIMLGSLLIGTIYSNQLPIVASSVEASHGDYINYTVKSGDTLWKIANIYGVSVDDIKSSNNMEHVTIYVDQILKIPSTNYFEYIVSSGDTLYKIASENRTTVDKIKQLNNLLSDMIYPGQRIILEKSVSTQTTTYVVKSGDTLWKIARSANLSVDTLKIYNDLKTDTIYVGQVLKLTQDTPTQSGGVEYTSYSVKKGDTQWSIAIDHGIPVYELQKANGLSEDSTLSLGQTLKVPVHIVPVMQTKGENYGEYMDWWSGAQYVFPINKQAKIVDIDTGKSFNIKRTIGANHADCEPLTYKDTQIAKDIWGGYSWKTRAVLVIVEDRQLAASMSFLPHGIEYITNNDFSGHFDIHFLNSTRHVDGQIDPYHQEMIKKAAGIF